MYVRATLFSFGMVSRLSIFLSLLSYIYFGNYITARKVFIVSSYFNILNESMVQCWPIAITSVAEGYISVKRVQEFLLASSTKQIAETPHDNLDAKKLNEYKRKNVVPVGQLNGNNGNIFESKTLLTDRRSVNEDTMIKGITISNASAVWKLGEAGESGIAQINLSVKDRELCAIVGQVGSGKTTLLQVILGELELDSGTIKINGVWSYASQESWLFEGSIRNNIIFIEEFDEHRYRDVVRVCALEQDFKLLPHGDETIVGERGISLSGGQKARVNLARAIYKQADIYLLDDPLSAVDAHVGKHIFQECIQQYLANKICILVTHQLQYLTEVEHLVVLNHGHIEAQGSYAELRERQIDSLVSIHVPDNMNEIVAQKKIKVKKLNIFIYIICNLIFLNFIFSVNYHVYRLPVNYLKKKKTKEWNSKPLDRSAGVFTNLTCKQFEVDFM